VAAEQGAGPATDFTKWLDSIGGKQRQLFDAPEPNGGFALIWSYVFLLTGAQAYALPDKDLGVVVVLRHNGIPLGFKDELWSKYKLGEFFKITDPVTKAPATRNFFLNSKPEDLVVPDASIDRLMARGVKVAVCNMAITVLGGMVAKDMNLPADQVRKEWIAGMVPGTQLVPSGVVAINGAQSRGCAYCFAG
jgi:intracellular sulfur oxidation DsrE/DsrF family protein